MSEILLWTAAAVYVLFFCAVFYIFFIADPSNSAVAKFLLLDVPQRIVDMLKQLLPSSITDATMRYSNSITRVTQKLFYEENPALQVFYLFLVLGSWSIMFFYGYPYIPNRYVPAWHRWSGYILFVLCLGSYIGACQSSPGNITAATLFKYDHYPYDHILYTPQVCPTLRIRKLPRSKYDRMTKKHVPRFDHYCGWISKPVGEENYRVFLLFLIIHVFMCWYGATATALIFKSEMDSLWDAQFIDIMTGLPVTPSGMVVSHFLIMRMPQLAVILLLMSVMGLVLGGFLSFHIYLICRGMTTNEFYKWSHVKKHYKRNKKYQSGNNASEKMAKVAREATDSSQRDVNHATLSQLNAVAQAELDVGCVTALPHSDALNASNCPNHETRQRLEEESKASVPASRDAVMQKQNEAEPQGSNESAELADHYLENLYNLGILENFKEVLWPRSLRHEIDQRKPGDSPPLKKYKGT